MLLNYSKSDSAQQHVYRYTYYLILKCLVGQAVLQVFALLRGLSSTVHTIFSSLISLYIYMCVCVYIYYLLCQIALPYHGAMQLLFYYQKLIAGLILI